MGFPAGCSPGSRAGTLSGLDKSGGHVYPSYGEGFMRRDRWVGRTLATVVAVLACADDLKAVHEKTEANNCRTSTSAIGIAAGPTSFELIEAALTSGDITA